MEFKICTDDADFAEVSLFMLENKRELHPSFTTMGMVPLIYSYVTQGYIVKVTNIAGQIEAVGAYFQGTPDNDFKDKKVALIDLAIIKKEYRGTKLFLNGLQYMISHIMEEHPEVEDLKIVAYADNNYVCRLYSKFMNVDYYREGAIGKEVVFCSSIRKIVSFLNRVNKL